jgi:hypothetical protein
MPLTEKQKKIIVAGGLLAAAGVTAIIVHQAVAKPPTPPTPVTPPPPGTVPGIPAVILAESYPSTHIQQVGFVRVDKKWKGQCLDGAPCTKIENGTCYVGLSSSEVTVQVLDAAGKPVPDVPLLFWSRPTSDDQGGTFWIEFAEHPSTNPLKVLTGSDGRARVSIQYNPTDEAMRILESRHDIKCCDFMGVAWPKADISWDDRCCDVSWRPVPIPAPFPSVPCWTKSAEASTDARIYAVHIEVEGAPAKYTEVVISCQFKSKCLWK